MHVTSFTIASASGVLFPSLHALHLLHPPIGFVDPLHSNTFPLSTTLHPSVPLLLTSSATLHVPFLQIDPSSSPIAPPPADSEDTEATILVPSAPSPSVRRTSSTKRPVPSKPPRGSRRSSRSPRPIPSPLYSATQAKFSLFFDDEAKTNWNRFADRGILCEKRINYTQFLHLHLIDWLQDLGILDSVTFPQSFSPALVREFYTNLKGSIGDSTSPHHHLVYVRKSMVPFSPTAINHVFNFEPRCHGHVFGDDMCLTDPKDMAIQLTGGRLTDWNHELGLIASALSMRNSILFKLVCSN